MMALSAAMHQRKSSKTDYKLSISPAQITNFKSLSKLKLKPRRRAHAGSITKRKIPIQSKIIGNGFLDRVQHNSSHKPLIPSTF
jgi:hypothetical protein